MDASKRILFIGQDEKYWSSIQERFAKKYPDQQFDFTQIYKKEDKLFQNLIIDIAAIEPDVIFIDYSTDPHKLMTLARLIRRCFPYNDAVIGLWGYLADPAMIKESNTTGVFINHIKSGEFDDILYHSQLLSQKNSLELPQVASAKIPIDYSVDFGSLVKIGYITPTSIHIEDNLLFANGQEIILKTQFHSTFDVKFFTVENCIASNLYYTFKHGHDLTINFKHEYLEEEGIVPDLERKRKDASTQEKSAVDAQKSGQPQIKINGDIVKSKYLTWFKSRYTPPTLINDRILVLDHTMTILKVADKPLDGYANSIRFSKEIDPKGSVITEVMPGLIAYQYKDETEEQKKEEENRKDESETSTLEKEQASQIYGDQALRLIISKIDSIPDYNPYILVFNAKLNSNELKNLLNYDRIISDGHQFNFEKVLHLCDAFNKKRQTEFDQQDEEEKKLIIPKIFLDKKSDESNAEFIIKAKIIEISESYTIFTTEQEIPMHSVFHLKDPANIFVSVIPEVGGKVTKIKGGYQYLGVNHGVQEKERARLRRFVNEMIYLPKKLKKEAEEAEVKARQKEFLEKQKKAAEDAKKVS